MKRARAATRRFIWDRYRGIAEMPRLPSPAELRDEVDRRSREGDPPPSEPEIAVTLLGDLDVAQSTIDNRAEATVKLNAFALAGVTALSKADGRPFLRVVGLCVLLTAGTALVCALQATSPVFMRDVLLRAATVENVAQACRRLERNQMYLAGATLATILAGTAAGLAIVVALLPK